MRNQPPHLVISNPHLSLTMINPRLNHTITITPTVTTDNGARTVSPTRKVSITDLKPHKIYHQDLSNLNQKLVRVTVSLKVKDVIVRIKVKGQKGHMTVERKQLQVSIETMRIGIIMIGIVIATVTEIITTQMTDDTMIKGKTRGITLTEIIVMITEGTILNKVLVKEDIIEMSQTQETRGNMIIIIRINLNPRNKIITHRQERKMSIMETKVQIIQAMTEVETRDRIITHKTRTIVKTHTQVAIKMRNRRVTRVTIIRKVKSMVLTITIVTKAIVVTVTKVVNRRDPVTMATTKVHL